MPRPVATRGEFSAEEKATIGLFGKARDSVVFITTRSGIVAGDIITAVEGKPVDSVGKFAARQDEFKVGDRIRMTLLRQGRSAEAFVTLQQGE